ncbi:hypothetical protein SAMN05421738_1239 [Algoriella xinjiangensis]|uniref:Uncharacterized protein n=1 Tax=Algoriella xinjiangensis TaxID=684065 RepID=A0A1I5B841_9FLAO|nr:hypothetical protein [Algoriella xinjiangensis]SFN70873.1 hypothetical protein SAMN05421738_1239 [Algoriella xinjiangensis]
MSENNRPKSPSEILEGLSNEANRMALLAKEIDEKIYAFYSVQKQFIENGNTITAEQNRILNELKSYKSPNISLDPYAKKQMEELKEYDKKIRKKDRTIPYLILIIFLLLATFIYFFNQDLKTKKEVKENLMSEIYSKGDTIVNKNDFDLANKNSKLMNEWIDKNPKDSEKFILFFKKKTTK